MQYLLLLIPLLIGMGIVIQSGANTQLSHIFGNPFIATFVSFAVGAVSMLVINILLRSDFSVFTSPAMTQTRWWMWTGGLLGAFFILSVIVIAPRIGPTQLFGLIIASQLIFSVAVDHFGWLGFEVQPINVRKAAGILLLMGGTFLIQWGKQA